MEEDETDPAADDGENTDEQAGPEIIEEDQANETNLCNPRQTDCDDPENKFSPSPDNVYIDNSATYEDEYGAASNVKLLIFDSVSNNDPAMKDDLDA